MGFRFQKRIKLLPGVTINVSKSGLSTSIGPKGAKVTLGHGKVRKTVGLPGTGLSHTTVENIDPEPSTADTNDTGMSMGTLLIVGLIGLFAFLLIFG